MPHATDKSGPPMDIKVFIRNPRGDYLAEDDSGLFFSSDRTGALILNYRADQVEAQLENIQKTQGITLVPDPVPPEEIYETCDRCKELFLPFMTFFDGKTFLCPDCRKRRPVSRAARM